MASTWLQQADSFINPENSKEIQTAGQAAVAAALQQSMLSIEKVVQGLGPYLTSEDNSVRARGTLLLGKLLEDSPKVPLPPPILSTLCNFFAARLSDWPALPGALCGSLALAQRQLAAEEARQLSARLFTDVQVQAQKRAERQLAYALYETLLTQHAPAVRQLGADVINGVIGAMDGEQDPRCLLAAFGLVGAVSRMFPEEGSPLAGCASELFDVCCCYFPLSFKADALCSTSLFGPFLLPLLLDKLASDLPTAKVESLKCLRAAVSKLPPAMILDHCPEIWAGLKAEILPASGTPVGFLLPGREGQDAEVASAAASCLTEIGRCDGVLASEVLRLLLVDDTLPDLFAVLGITLENATSAKRPESQQLSLPEEGGCGHDHDHDNESEPGDEPVVEGGGGWEEERRRGSLAVDRWGLLLRAVASCSQESGREVLAQVGGKVLAVAGGRASGRLGLEGVWALRVLLEAVKGAGAAQSRLGGMVEGVLGVFCRVVEGEGGGGAAMLGVEGLEVIGQFPLESSQQRHLVDVLTTFLLGQTAGSEAATRVSEALSRIGAAEEQAASGASNRGDAQEDGAQGLAIETGSEGSAVLQLAVPKLLVAMRGAESAAGAEVAVGTLARLAHVSPAVRLVVMQSMGELLQQALSASEENTTEQEVSVEVLRALEDEILPSCDTQLPDQLAATELAVALVHQVADLSKKGRRLPPQVEAATAGALRVATQQCLADRQAAILGEALACWNPPGGTESACQVDATSASVASILIGLRPDTGVGGRSSLFADMVRIAGSESVPRNVSEVAAMAAASLANKWPQNGVEGPSLEKALGTFLEEGLGGLGGGGGRWVRSLGWVGKGLAMRGHAGVGQVAKMLLEEAGGGGAEVAGDSAQSQADRVAASESDRCQEEGSASPAGDERRRKRRVEAGCGLGLLVEGSRGSHSVERVLWRQRVFVGLLGPLGEAITAAGGDEEMRFGCHYALAALIRGTAPGVVLSEVTQGLDALRHDDSTGEVLGALLLALSTFLVNSAGLAACASQAPLLLKRLLPLVSYRHSQEVREGSLQCLLLALELPYHLLFPMHTQVLKGLAPALDDPKRAVRKEAGRCKRAW